MRDLATVITNFLSAVPYIGKDLVELVWGGLYTDGPQYGDVLLKILLIAGKSSNKVYDSLRSWGLKMDVKKAIIRRQSAGVKASQRLDAGDLRLAYLVGLYEGDGYFSITKNGKDVKYEIGIELSIRDVQLIYKIKSIWGIGKVSFRERGEIRMVSLRIRKKEHIKSRVMPIFDKYQMFSKKHYDYLRMRDALVSDVKYYDELSEYKRSDKPINNVESIKNSYYFTAWLVGFIEAEGCFSIYKEKGKHATASFDISQTDSETEIEAIKEYLSISNAIYKDKTNNYRLKVSSIRSIENVIKFLGKAPVKLLGNKRLQYILWLKNLRTIPRYSRRIAIPSRY